MQSQPPSEKMPLRSVAYFIFWTLIFAVAYAQSPLYTSNQNQYFLHGLANTGFGVLQTDWLANTLDPTPVFSLIISLTYRYLRVEAIFYVYYAILMGIYLFSLLGIISELFHTSNSKTGHRANRSILTIALLVAVHSAALRFTFSRTLGVNWTYVLEDGFAHQRMLGPVFQPSTFGVLLVLSIYLFLRRKPYLAVLAATLAATIHPTYLIGSAILTSTYMLTTWIEEREILPALALGGMALLSISPILLYVINVFGGTVPEAVERSREILVTFRIPHHAVVGQWFDATAVVKIVIITAAIYVVRKSRLFLILLTSFLTIAALTIARVLLDSNTLALLFPWRLSILILPLSTTILLASVVSKFLDSKRFQSDMYQKAIYAFSLTLIFLAVLIGGIRFKLDLARKASIPERSMFDYVYAQKTPGDTYLIPVKMVDFRLATGAPIYIDFNSIPYKETDVLEWYRRERLADRFYKNEDCDLLESIATEAQVTHVVLKAENFDMECPSLEEKYHDNLFGVYSLDTHGSR